MPTYPPDPVAGTWTNSPITMTNTISRLFPAETGLTLKAWRQRARIVRTIERLARGDAPAEIAREAGFASTAAYSYAFRQITATTPMAFMSRKR